MNATRSMLSGIARIAVAVACLSGCSSSSTTSGTDAGSDATSGESGSFDGATKKDSGRGDGASSDAGPGDGSHDSISGDGGLSESSSDSGSDTGPDNSGLGDGGSGDAGSDVGVSCVISGTAYPSGTASPKNPCQSCQPGTSATSWTSVEGANASCPTGDVCNGSPAACVSGCWIGGAFYTPGAITNVGCEVCTPATSTTAWTNVTGVASCPSGEACNMGSCASGCFIAGTFYASGAANMGNDCEVCTPGTSRMAWTDSVLSCNDGAATCFSGSCVMPASCAAGGDGMTNCGPGGSGSESCCTSLEVMAAFESEASPFYRTYTYGETSSYADPATVSGFRLDEYLVTVGRFRQFVAAWTGGYYPAAGSGIHAHLHGG